MEISHIEVAMKMREALSLLESSKPKDRSELDRDYQIVITDFSKLLAYFEHRVVEGKR